MGISIFRYTKYVIYLGNVCVRFVTNVYVLSQVRERYIDGERAENGGGGWGWGVCAKGRAEGLFIHRPNPIITWSFLREYTVHASSVSSVSRVIPLPIAGLVVHRPLPVHQFRGRIQLQ